MPPKITVRSVGKASIRKKGEDADAGYKKGSISTTAPRRAKRANSSKRFRDEDEGYDEAYAEIPLGAEVVGVGADDLEELEEDDDDYIRLGHEDEHEADFSKLQLKPDHQNRPLWVCPDGRIFLETYSPVYKQAYDFLIAVAEPVCRPEAVHEYVMTPHSLYAAVSVGLETDTIVSVLNRLSKVSLPAEIRQFVHASTGNYGKVKLVLQRNAFFVESPFPDVLHTLLQDETISRARVIRDNAADFTVANAPREQAAIDLTHVDAADPTDDPDNDAEPAQLEKDKCQPSSSLPGTADQSSAAAAALAMDVDPDRMLHSFEIDSTQVEHVKQRCLPGGLNYPMLEEYDFRNDTQNPDLSIDLKPHVSLRPYQEKSLSKMFGNGRARSGIIVLPCGAGKSLVGVAAASRIKKSVLCLVTNSVSVDQWKHQFKLWTGLQDHQISRFTSDQKEGLTGVSGVTITTYTMIAFSGKRSEESARVMDQIRSREWGLLLMDEVHVVPAQMFRKVIGIVKAHCKLGLTATLVREDERIADLNFLIGPKLYEANWLDLTRAGHIANVQCAEVWCPMTKEFYREYLKPSNAAKQKLLYAMNPNKFQACQFLIQYHEQVRGDKIIVFSDNIFSLRNYAVVLKKPFIYGGTSHAERTRVLHAFKHNPQVTAGAEMTHHSAQAVQAVNDNLVGTKSACVGTHDHDDDDDDAVVQVNTVFLSKVGDNSIDIPEANVLIQISSHAGSRRQEAQRLGRILRAKKAKPGAAGAEEYNAFFYTLVSKDTQEMYYSTKRQQFLIDQGYSFKVITNLLDATEGDNLFFSKQPQQLELLAEVLLAGEDEAAEEADTAADDVSKTAKAVARRTAGSMSKISGSTGNYYAEFGTGEKAIAQYGRGQASKRGRPDAPRPKAVNKQSLTYKFNR